MYADWEGAFRAARPPQRARARSNKMEIPLQRSSILRVGAHGRQGTPCLNAVGTAGAERRSSTGAWTAALLQTLSNPVLLNQTYPLPPSLRGGAEPGANSLFVIPPLFARCCLRCLELFAQHSGGWVGRRDSPQRRACGAAGAVPDQNRDLFAWWKTAFLTAHTRTTPWRSEAAQGGGQGVFAESEQASRSLTILRK